MTREQSVISSGVPTSGKDASLQAGQVYTDLNGMQAIKRQAGTDRDAAMHSAAKQFESLFVSMMMKQMRQSNEVFGKDSYLSSDAIKFHQQMLDQQMSINLAEGRGMGLADVIYHQLTRNSGKPQTTDAITADKPMNSAKQAGAANMSAPVTKLAAFDPAAVRVATVASVPLHTLPDIADPVAVSVDPDVIDALQASGVFDDVPDLEQLQAQMARFFASASVSSRQAERVRQVVAGEAGSGTPEAFIQRAYHAAKQVAQRLGVDVQAVLAQSALESGWGENADNNNLFGIKADSRWVGDRSLQSTLEFRGGALSRESAWFRRYGSWDQSFNDYGDLIRNNPRYQQALSVGDNPHAYAAALQRAGYATDPGYARKISDIINSERFQQAVSQMALSDTRLSNAELSDAAMSGAAIPHAATMPDTATVRQE